MKPIPTALTAICLLGLAACGDMSEPAAGPQPDAGSTVPVMAGPDPIDAALVTPEFGWILTPDELLVSQDGGTTRTRLDVPVPAGEARAASFADRLTGMVAAAAGESITVATTHDGGRTWRTATVRGPAAGPAGFSSLAASFGDGAHAAVVARVATSQAFSLGTIFATADGGASWSARPAPEAGAVRVEPGGRIWLAGTGLHSTTDQGQTWTKSELALAGQVTAAAVAPPVAGTIPVTVASGERTEVQLLTTGDDGRTWGRPSRLPIRGMAGPGVRLAVAGTPTGPVVYDNIAGHAYRRDGTDLRPSGLPDGVRAVTFAADGQHGWALAGYGACADGKRDCRYHHSLLATTDGGATWRATAAWTRVVS